MSGFVKTVSLSVLLLSLAFKTCLAAPPYLQQLQQQAEILKLAEKPLWQHLLHYQNTLFDSQSLIQNNDFFFHPNGKQNPQAELNATLAQFFVAHEEDDEAAQCRFPARYLWLTQQLHIDTQYLPQPHCKTLHNWLNNLDVKGITLVFPVAYLNNPASMFGHSFLKLDQQRTTTGSELLAWTVNYAAVTEKERGIRFAVKGLFGGYDGQFTLAPYYVLLKEYADLDNRDLWEYQLNFNDHEIKRLLLHLWELLPAKFDYYFINKNCSYQLLALLEVARPQLNLTAKFNFDAIPADTIRAITSQNGILKKSHYRPALASTLKAKASLLNKEHQQLAKALALEETSLTALSQTTLSATEKAQILELAFEYLSYLNAKKIKSGEHINGQLAYDLLAARSHIKLQLAETSIPTPDFRPDEGHAGNRLQLAYGYHGEQYIEAAYRWSYHDHYDPQQGFIKGAQVEFFKPALRYYPKINKFSLESIELFNINSMPAYDDFLRSFSWQIAVGANRARFDDNQRHLMATAKMGTGMSYYPSTNSLLSLNALASFEFSPQFKQYSAIAVGANTLFQYDPNSLWRIGVETGFMHYFQGITRTSYYYRLKQRVNLNRHSAILLDLSRIKEFSNAEFNAQLALRFYF